MVLAVSTIKNATSSVWVVYILQCGDGSLYTGITTNVERRLLQHRTAKGAKYTRSHLPVTVVYTEDATDRSAATIREAEIKKLSRVQKLRLISNNKC